MHNSSIDLFHHVGYLFQLSCAAFITFNLITLIWWRRRRRSGSAKDGISLACTACSLSLILHQRSIRRVGLSCSKRDVVLCGSPRVEIGPQEMVEYQLVALVASVIYFATHSDAMFTRNSRPVMPFLISSSRSFCGTQTIPLQR
uniref:Uncharacterized protein n=1 Tax=Noccaea caerulescens TaxID=107243 RepID=A0A1J3D1M6_NOCCA